VKREPIRNHFPHPVAPRWRMAASAVAVAAVLACAGTAHALGFGRMNVQSALGEPLQAEIDITSLSSEQAASLRVNIAPAEVYRAAGMEYSELLRGAKVEVARRADGRAVLRISSDRAARDPFVDLILQATWASGRLVREYTVLLDPPRPGQATTEASAGAAGADRPGAGASGWGAPLSAAAGPAPAPVVPATPTARQGGEPGSGAKAGPERAERPAAPVRAERSAAASLPAPPPGRAGASPTAQAPSAAPAPAPAAVPVPVPAPAQAVVTAPATGPTPAMAPAPVGTPAGASAAAPSGPVTGNNLPVAAEPPPVVAAAGPKAAGPDNATSAVEAAMAAQAGNVVSPAAAAPPLATTTAEAPAPTPAPTALPKAGRGKSPVAATPAPQPAVGKRREVRAGETLYAIALENRPEAVSLDQMLAALYRGNPEAFAGENMNRLLAGAVLQVPAAELAGAIPRAEARALIEAHSSDLAAYRQRLAAKPAAAGGDEAQRRASGSVQARVQDRKQAAAPTPDQLKLSRSEVKASAAPTPEATLSRQAEARELAQREAEVQRNVEALRQLKGGSASAGGGGGAGPADNGAAVAKATAAAPAAGASMPGAALVAAAPPAALAAAGEAAAPAAPAPPAPASAAAAPAVAAASAASAPAPGASEPVHASRLQDSLLSSPYILAAGAALVLSVAGLTVLGLLRRRRTPAPASAPGVQERADDDIGLGSDDAQALAARPPRPAFDAALADATAMAQDVPVLDDAVVDPQPSARPADPLAEAEVYLAYGRVDEAVALLRAAVDAEPRRSDIVFKLLELHASRQEVEAFEAVADVMYRRTGGQGAEWARVVALQRTLVPEVDEMFPTDVAAPELPARVATPPAAAQAVPSRAPVAAVQAAPAARPPAERQEPTLGPEPADLPASDFALDLDVDAADATRPAVARQGLDLGGVDRPEAVAPAGPAGSALERKLALAEEFIQIGDVEGARDLLGEVGSQGDGPLRERARRLLDALG